MAADSFLGTANYTESWASIYSIQFPPEIWKEWYQKYGKGFKMLDFLNMTGRTGASVANRSFSHFEDAACDKVINNEGGIAQTGAGLALAAFQIETTDYVGDATNGYYPPLREHDSVLIPAEYMANGEDRLYVVTAVGGATNNLTFTLHPLANDSNLVVGGIPASTEMMIGPTYFAAGTTQPDAKAIGTYERSHSTQISKESCGFEGGQVGRRNYREVITNGGPGLFDKGTVETEFRLDGQMDKSIFLGEPNTNVTSALTQTSSFGGTNARLGTKGLWTWQLELAQTKNYTDTFSMDDFDDIKPLLQSQGVVDSTVLFGYGATLGLQVENGVLEGMKEWSGGTNLFVDNKFGVVVKGVTKNSVNFVCKEFVSFSNPNLLGSPSYNFDTSGFMIPISDVPVRIGDSGSKTMVPNLSLAYYNHNGEDRTRIIGTVAGLNGLGYNIVNDADGTMLYMLSEFALFCANVNQHIQVTRTP